MGSLAGQGNRNLGFLLSFRFGGGFPCFLPKLSLKSTRSFPEPPRATDVRAFGSYTSAPQCLFLQDVEVLDVRTNDPGMSEGCLHRKLPQSIFKAKKSKLLDFLMFSQGTSFTETPFSPVSFDLTPTYLNYLLYRSTVQAPCKVPYGRSILGKDLPLQDATQAACRKPPKEKGQLKQ